MKIDLTKITATITGAEIYGRDEIEIPDSKRVEALAIPHPGDVIVYKVVPGVSLAPMIGKVALLEKYDTPRLILEDIPLRRTITLQATGEIRRLKPREIGLTESGFLFQPIIDSAGEMTVLRLVSDQEEPER